MISYCSIKEVMLCGRHRGERSAGRLRLIWLLAFGKTNNMWMWINRIYDDQQLSSEVWPSLYETSNEARFPHELSSSRGFVLLILSCTRDVFNPVSCEVYPTLSSVLDYLNFLCQAYLVGPLYFRNEGICNALLIPLSI